jgi:hypothetical protein
VLEFKDGHATPAMRHDGVLDQVKALIISGHAIGAVICKKNSMHVKTAEPWRGVSTAPGKKGRLK